MHCLNLSHIPIEVEGEETLIEPIHFVRLNLTMSKMLNEINGTPRMQQIPRQCNMTLVMKTTLVTSPLTTTITLAKLPNVLEEANFHAHF